MKTYTRVSLLALLLVAGAVQPARGQVLISLLLGDKVSSERFHLELNVGANFADLNGVDDTKLKPGFMLGIGGEWRFAGDFLLQPELVPFYSTGAKEMPTGGINIPPPIDTLVSDLRAERTLKYFAIPVLIKYGALGRQLHLGAGPQIGFLLSANDKFQGVINNDITVDEDIEEVINSTDAGVVFNVSYKLRPSYGTGINLRYYLGLTDIIKDNPGDAVYNRVLSIFVSLAIGDDPSEDN